MRPGLCPGGVWRASLWLRDDRGHAGPHQRGGHAGGACRGVVACRARISMVGAVTRAQADAMAKRLLSRRRKCPAPACRRCLRWRRWRHSRSQRRIRLPFDSAQAHVLIGQPGYKRDDPDFFALTGRQLHPGRRRLRVAADQ